MLNAVALAFVLDVDDLLAYVLLSEKKPSGESTGFPIFVGIRSSLKGL